MFTTEEKQKFLKLLKRAYYSGASEVQYNDRKVKYKSNKEMQQAIRDLEEELGLKKKGGGRQYCGASKGTC